MESIPSLVSKRSKTQKFDLAPDLAKYFMLNECHRPFQQHTFGKNNGVHTMLTAITKQRFSVSIFLVVSLFFRIATCTFTIYNYCPYTIWPGTLGTPQLSVTGFELNSGQSMQIPSVPGWSGRIWARTGCTFDASGAGACRTGDCGGRLECGGIGATPPASLFEITIGQGEEKDFYDVSFVDGYNLPLVAAPRGVYGACNITGCATDINIGCPKELQVGNSGGVVACRSACEAFGLDQYCCSGEYANPTTCHPSFYSNIFKRACPKAYSYAYDDGTSTFTCKASEYAIVFCPDLNTMKQSNGTEIASPEIQKNTKKGSSNEHNSSSSITEIPFSLAFFIFFLACNILKT